MRRVLIVAYYFPPIGGIGSIRMASFMEYLPEFGWEPTVLAPRGTPHATDRSLSFPENKVVRSRSIELARAGGMITGSGEHRSNPTGGRGRGTRAALRRFVLRYVLFPDPQVGWYPGAVWSGLRALREAKFDAIYSSSVPITAHLVARAMSRKSGLPWLAEFRDPWSDRLPGDHPYRRGAVSLERAIGRRATEVIFTSPSWAERYGHAWGRPIRVIPNGHDLEKPPEVGLETHTLSYVGTYYPGMQTLDALWAALGRMEKGSDQVPRVRLIGEFSEELRSERAERGLDGEVEATGLLPHHEVLREMARSSILVAAGATDPISRGWIPAKLFEYLISGRPILYLGDPEGDAGRMLSTQPGCHVVEPSDVDGVVAALRADMDAPSYERDVDQFSRKARTRELARVLDEAVNGSGRA
jgi:glycosyltransferase involved in cell wall biosynthesis